MKKYIALLLFMLPASLLAYSGVVIEAKGNVTITDASKTVSAKTGSQFQDGANIVVSAGGNATLMFANGIVKKLGAGEKFTATKDSATPQGGSSLVKGIAMAYNDAARANKGPTVHGMVKGAPGRKEVSGKWADPKLEPARLKEMQEDLTQINTMGLQSDGKALMQAQVYYKYQQFQKMTNTLLPVYKSQTPPAEMVKNLLALGYEKMGNPAKADNYRK